MAQMIEKERALAGAVTQIERAYGKGSIMKLGEVSAQKIDPRRYPYMLMDSCLPFQTSTLPIPYRRSNRLLPISP